VPLSPPPPEEEDPACVLPGAFSYRIESDNHAVPRLAGGNNAGTLPVRREPRQESARRRRNHSEHPTDSGVDPVRMRSLTVSSAALALALAAPAAPALAHEGGDVDEVRMKTVLAPGTSGSSDKMVSVANLQYDKTGSTSQSGSDIELARISGRDYAFAGTLRNGLQIVDVTDPANPVSASVYDCKVSQGDVQVFRQGERVLATYTADGTFGAAGAASQCATDLGLVGSSSGTVIVDVTNPAAPTSVGFAPVPRGSHNMTVHPSGNYLYNSNSDLLTSTMPTITIFNIREPAAPVKVQDFPTPFVPASLGSESHDITFSPDGSRAYSAALSQSLILDTADPENPKQLAQIIDPTVNLSHGADPIVLKKNDGTDRELLLVSDEQAGAAAGTNCPGGGVHVYDITGELETAPKKLGIWFIGETGPSAATCTAHVFKMHGDQGLFTIAWYDQGVRVVDVAGLADLPTPAVPFVTSGSGNGIKEIGRYTFDDANTWSFKTNRIATDGSFIGYGNDLGRGRRLPLQRPGSHRSCARTDRPQAGRRAGPGACQGQRQEAQQGRGAGLPADRRRLRAGRRRPAAAGRARRPDRHRGRRTSHPPCGWSDRLARIVRKPCYSSRSTSCSTTYAAAGHLRAARLQRQPPADGRLDGRLYLRPCAATGHSCGERLGGRHIEPGTRLGSRHAVA